MLSIGLALGGGGSKDCWNLEVLPSRRWELDRRGDTEDPLI